MNRFVRLLGVAIVCRWELERTRTSWNVLANVKLCLCLQLAFLLPQCMAVLIFLGTFAGHLIRPSFPTSFCENELKIFVRFLSR